MSERSSKAFIISVLLHGGMVGLVLFFTYAVGTTEKEPPKIFELVAGEGDNYGALEAPALGVPGGDKTKVTVPAITAEPAVSEPPPQPQPEPPSPAPQPVPAEPDVSPVKPVETKPVPKPKPTETTPDFSKIVKRKAAQKEARIIAADKKKQAEIDRKAKIAAAAEAKRISKAEFDKQNAGKNKPPSGSGASGKVTHVGEGITGGVVGGSTNNKTGGAGGKALTRDEQDLLDAYTAMLIQRLQAAHEKPPGLSDLLKARVRFEISASGAISNPRIVQSSGNEEFDQSALAAFNRIKPIGAPPNGKGDTWTVMFKMHEDDN